MRKPAKRLSFLCASVMLAAGCNSLMNDWLRVTNPGVYGKQKTLEIRTSLSFEDTPSGIPGAVYPTKEDLQFEAIEYPISPGDSLAIEIYELRQRGLPYQIQAVVTNTGYLNLPVIGRIPALGLNVIELEEAIKEDLKAKKILMRPEVTVNPLFLQKSTYSVFGIGASGATNAPLRAGSFPLRRADTRVLEAINQVGGLNEAVIDVYVFRYDDYVSRLLPTRPDKADEITPEPGAPMQNPEDEAEEGGVSPPAPKEEPAPPEDPATTPEEAELINVVVSSDPAVQEDELVAPAPAEELDVDRPQPWIWQDGEFVPNPALQEAADGERPILDPASTLAAKTPAVDWSRVAGEATYRIIRIPAERLRDGDPAFDIYVRAGDVIRIVSGEIGLYWMMGQVARVGPYTFNNEPITLKGALAAAGGLGPDAWPTRCTVYRRVGAREQMIPVNIDKIFAGEEPDFYIKRGDIINVGTHPLAPWLQRLRAFTLPTPVNNVGYSFTYSRNFADIDSFGGRANPHNEPDEFPNLFP